MNSTRRELSPTHGCKNQDMVHKLLREKKIPSTGNELIKEELWCFLVNLSPGPKRIEAAFDYLSGPRPMNDLDCEGFRVCICCVCLSDPDQIDLVCAKVLEWHIQLEWSDTEVTTSSYVRGAIAGIITSAAYLMDAEGKEQGIEHKDLPSRRDKLQAGICRFIFQIIESSLPKQRYLPEDKVVTGMISNADSFLVTACRLELQEELFRPMLRLFAENQGPPADLKGFEWWLLNDLTIKFSTTLSLEDRLVLMCEYSTL